MIKSLYLKNLILIEEAHIELKTGFTVITGETGAGKTALIEALRLILGERADSSKVRKGCEKALVQASFDQMDKKALAPFLEELGILIDDEDEILFSREIRRDGKSRAFLSGQLVPAASLQVLAPLLIDFVGQHAQITLKSTDTQRKLLDQFAQVDLQPFQALWKQEKEKLIQLQHAKEKKETAERKKELLQEELDELLEISVKEGEEEELFEEYSLLTNTQELMGYSEEILSLAEHSLSSSLQMGSLLEKCLKYEKGLIEAKESAREAHLQLRELVETVQSFQSRLENDPARVTILEHRLRAIASLKKKYGDNLPLTQKTREEELFQFENLDEEIAQLEKEAEEAQSQTRGACENIRIQREKGAKKLGSLLSIQLQELNIPNAEVKIILTPIDRCLAGEEHIEFFLRANKGEQLVPVKDSSSGGEVSRLLFALKLILSEKKEPKTMVFDEIDANVGGETATIIGKKLHEMGKNGQILCITHFPQVASYGDHHLVVTKKEVDGRTTSSIAFLDSCTREKELLRMLGGKSLVSPSL